MLPVRDNLPTRTVPFVNYALIAANVAVFALTLTGGPDALMEWALVPADLTSSPVAAVPTLLTSMFLHGGIAHILGNMLFLWVFGDNVEDALGHGRYLFFYLGCGVAAGLTQVVLNVSSTVPMVGASGAIAGVLAAYGVLYPMSPITVINPIPLLWLFWGLFIYLPAWIVILEFFVINVLNAVGSAGVSSGVAFAAHVGGFIAGLALLALMRNRQRVEHDRWERWAPPRRR